MANFQPIPKGGKTGGGGFLPRAGKITRADLANGHELPYRPGPLHLTKADLSRGTPFSSSPVVGRVPRRPPHDLPLPGPKNNLKPTPGKTPVTKKTVLPAPKAKRPSYTAAQEATMHAQQLLAPQYKQADVEAARQNEAIRRFTADAMQQLAGLAPQIGQDYNSALSAQTGLVNSAADSLRNANPQANVQSLLNAIGAPASQGQAATQGLGDAFNGAAAVGQYADSLPIGALRSQGLGAETLARLQPGFTALGGRQAQLSALQNQSDARAKIGEQLPALQQSWLASFKTNKNQQKQLAMEQRATHTFDSTKSRALGYQVDSTGAPIRDASGHLQVLPGFTQTKTGSVVKAYAPKIPKSAQVRIDSSVSSHAGRGIALDSQGKPVLINGKTIPWTASLAKASAAKAAQPFPNLTKTQVQHLRGGIAGAFYGVMDPKTHAWKVDARSGVTLKPLSYTEAITEAVREGYSREAATRMANRFYRAGRRGRPSLAAKKAVNKANAQARKGKDATGLGIQLP